MRELYTSAGSAASILQERHQDTQLKERVREYLGGSLPSMSLEQSQPVAMLARYVSRATGEDKIFADQAQKNGFTPYWATYLGDRFTTRNPEKVGTIRPPIKWEKGQRTRSWIVKADKREGGVGQLETIYGGTSSDYHRGVRTVVFEREGLSKLAENEFDMGEWYKRQAQRFGHIEKDNLAPFYYVATMALITVFGALYEDFNGGPNANSGDLARFRENVVYPAFDRVQQDLGVKPVIVQLPYQEDKGMEDIDLSFLDSDQAMQFRSQGPQSLLSGTGGTIWSR